MSKGNNEYLEGVNNILCNTIDNVLDLADKTNVKRNDAIKHFSMLISTMADVSDFKNYKRG